MSTPKSVNIQEKVSEDALYSIDDQALEEVRAQRAWMKDAKYFKRVTISPSAIIKMMVHGQSGVDKGIKRSGNPLEVMGLLVGHPDVSDPQRIIISDAQALPVEGFETRVIADDEQTLNYMIELGETNDLTRKDRFCGWYHTHPFDDMETVNNCYLSNTDISTQLQWQRSEDPHGNLWLAIVIDPLKSVRVNQPELRAFRVYPPEYSPPNKDETPDGSIEKVDRLRVERWGSCWNRYYELEINYHMSGLSKATLNILRNNFSWQNAISTTPFQQSGEQDRQLKDIKAVTSQLEAVSQSSRHLHSIGGNSNNHSSAYYPFYQSTATTTTTITTTTAASTQAVSSSSSAASSSSSSSSASSGDSMTVVGGLFGTSASHQMMNANAIGERIASEHCQCCASSAVKDSLFAAFQKASELRRNRQQQQQQNQNNNNSSSSNSSNCIEPVAMLCDNA